jgi:hypothetical protein
MADPASPSGATPEAGATPAGVAEAVPAPDTTDDELGEGGKAALATLRKELRTIKAERDELATAKRTAEDAERSELEKATASRDEATGRVSELELKVLKMTAAIDAGIPQHWSRLNGGNADELAADAKAFAKAFGPDNGNGEGATPADLGAGARPGTPATGNAGFNAAIRSKVRR